MSPSIKLVVVGNGTVGKTSLILTFAVNRFPHGYVPCIYDNHVGEVNIDGKEYSIDLWDTAGQDDFDRLRRLSYQNTEILLLCYSLVDRFSYGAIVEKWYPELHHYLPDVPIILVGTKLDLRDDKEEESIAGDSLSIEEGFKMQKKNDNVVKYMECSALTRQGVNEVFEEAARVALKYKQRTRAAQRKCVLL